ncbi:MAG TPA: isoprenylcysteine carboxylmethyltransferase family protein [Syntrophomonadaceae bacterium]|nr:isoprenylcysteine carboxylmethyltransferase family protein [Syntrophomonadaceae bacterium]HQE22672.1 isoprenylcysteine carboxylmethyltransferase family protein [Syntrophomonadaceae bacterium]
MNPRLRNVLIRTIISVIVFAYVAYLAYQALSRFDFLVITAFFAVFFAWSVIEIVIYKDPQSPVIVDNDQNTYLFLQLSSLLVLLYAIFDFTTYQWSRLTSLEPLVIYAGFVVFLINVLVRYAALTRLGSYFNLRVALYQEHQLVQTGIYQYIRHPMYLSALLNSVAVALIFSSWGALLVILFLEVPAVLKRIRVEEALMLEHFPDQYSAYMQHSKRIIPGIW